MSVPAFHRLSIAEVKRETNMSVAVTFEVPSHLKQQFRYLPGQHITLRAEIDGEDVRRSYSLCADAATGQLRVGIKRLRNGKFSTFANTQLQPGDLLDVMPPVGDFTLVPDPNSTNHYAAVAAGSGITPVLSLISTTLRAEPGCSWTLLLGNRSASSIMFLEELSDLKNSYPQRFHLIHVLSREQQPSPLLSGRINRERLEGILATLVNPDSVDLWFLCGPYQMVTTVREVLEDRGTRSSSIRDELFFAGPPPPLEEGDPVEGEVELIFTLDGRTSMVNMSQSTRVLDAALTIRHELPWSCRGGMCASCKAQIREGEVSMEHNYALVAEDLEAGFVLTCQALPRSERLVVDFDRR
jgi:ring-1,2-phenylacetyl-CoA epoxidase subunit PaaE